jgi:4-amino-4-deoxy-L-arabinose transferase-like glycosyltransferase
MTITSIPTLSSAARPAPLARRGAWLRDEVRRRGALAGLLVGTALLYLVGLSKSGWANQFYAAAAQAGSKSWTAFLFGSLDSSNFITVDKPPASLWVMDLSVRVFGVNSWAILSPQALEGVAAVALLYAAVRRVLTPSAGLLAGAILATTPVATLMFRFDNPDALLVLLTTAAAYCAVRAIEKARLRWLLLVGGLLGLAFLTKMLQGLIVVPAFAIAYLVAAPTSLCRRVGHVLAAGAAMVVAAGWWVALVELWPAGSRPYVGGSTDDSILQLTFGYNGFGRLTGSDNNGTPGGNGGGGFSSGQTGWTRLFGAEKGSQISWLLPAALVGVVALGWLTARSPRTDRLRASLLVWGGWLLITAVVLSFASGIIHPYYTVALAPAIAAVVALAVVALWRERSVDVARWALATLIAAGALWTFVLLGRVSWHPWMRWTVLIGGAATVAVLLTARVRAVVAAPLIALTLLIAPTAYSIQTASTAHTGAIPTAGPTTTAFGGPGGFGGGRPGGTAAGGAAPGGAQGFPARPGGTVRPGGTGSTGATSPTGGGFTRPGGLGGAGGGAGGFGSAGGLGGAGAVSSALSAALAK